MKILKLFVLLGNLFFSINLTAKEGFFEKNHFSEINPKWIQQTVMVYNERLHAPIGTAFLYSIDEKSAYFVSAKHVLTHCLIETKCSLRWETAWHKKDLTKDGKNPNTEFVSALSFKIEKIGVFQGKEKESLFASDLAIAIVDIKNLPQHFVSLGNEELEKSFKFQEKSSEINLRHFIIGYPALFQRPSLNHLEDSNRVDLRISEGTRLKIPDNLTREKYFKSDADSIGGNSGGPVVDIHNRLIGVLVGGPNSLEYTNYEPYSYYYSYITPLIAIKFMMGQFLLGKMQLTSF